MPRPRRRDCLALAGPLLVAGCGPGGRRLEAGGSTSFAPLLVRWAAEYRRLTGDEIDYLPRGSGYGVALVAAGALSFGVTDSPPTPAELGRAGGGLVLVPLAVGAVAVAVNLPGLCVPLALSGPVLADLFARRVTRWDDPAVAALNPGVMLPPLAVRPVVRAEGSGTTATLAAYLCRTSPRFAAEVGGGRKPRWPAGVVGQEGSDGVTGHVGRTPGSVGYVESGYARRAGLACVNLPGDDAVPVPPSAAAAGGYPLTGVGYGVLPARPLPAVGRFLGWCVRAGQRFAEPLDYAPLPPGLAGRAAELV